MSIFKGRNVKRSPVTTIVGILLIVAGILPFIMPSIITPDEAAEMKNSITGLGEIVGQAIVFIGGIIAMFAKDGNQ